MTQWSPILAVLALLVLGALCWWMMSNSNSAGEPAEAMISNNRKTKVTARSAVEVNPGDPQSSHGENVSLYVLLKFNDDFKDCQSFSRGSSHDPIRSLMDGAVQSNCIMIEQGLLITAEGPKEEVNFMHALHSSPCDARHSSLSSCRS